jgi:cyclopropane-fatty-acyl-phospholipid synthase
MNSLLRYLAFVPESIVFSPAYGLMRFMIRSPRPLDPEATWEFITRKRPPLDEWVRMNYPPAFVRRLLLSLYLRAPHEAGIAHHYDVSNEFYELFLDKKYMLYSCADFHTGKETLEEAQENKVRFIMNLVDPQPGEKIVELGCGWGGMLQEVFDRTGDRENLYGYTISQQQVEYNTKHRGFKVEFKNFITDEHPPEYFDKIYSIGAWEHVRKRDILPTFKKLHGTLKPGGKLIMHFFCPLTPVVPTAALVGQIFFPGSVIPRYQLQIRTAQAAGFRVLHQSIHDTYRDTLRHWFDRLVANRERAIELVGLANYNKWLVFFPCSWKYFDDVQAILVRFVFQKEC